MHVQRSGFTIIRVIVDNFHITGLILGRYIKVINGADET